MSVPSFPPLSLSSSVPRKAGRWRLGRAALASHTAVLGKAVRRKRDVRGADCMGRLLRAQGCNHT